MIPNQCKHGQVAKWCDTCHPELTPTKTVQPMRAKILRSERAEIRRAFADYIATEGCSCCRDIEGHSEAMKRLGKLLRMKKYCDGSGYDYSLYTTNKTP